ncbi:MAG: hypothetical protein ACJ76X_03620 [Solirubrobacteraceae bacterium]
MAAARNVNDQRPDPRAIDPADYLLERYAAHGKRSLKLSAYYGLKPLMPRRLQLAVRRAYATRQAKTSFPAWPIEPLLVQARELALRDDIARRGGGRVPFLAEWPDGHRFAAVLTHDVEGPAGADNVMRVIDVERRHGLVSSWNFVAEWYPIRDGLFDEIRAAKGEIGLHGIRHDGKLFADRDAFTANLPAIHRYLNAWQAVGFRSPATHRNAEWMPELGCLYDSSFPDTDPFEPQAGGCCSIFPFLIDGLVELPITLPQDHTLWEILRDESVELWRTKSDWIIDNRGLINVIVHPDYVLSDHRLALYDSFCALLRERLDARGGWHAVPRDVAMWWKQREQLRVVEGPDGPRVEGSDAASVARARVAFAELEDGQVRVTP